MASAKHPATNQASKLLHGDCCDLLRTLDTDSVDLVCTDPPYGIGFMGKAWDTFGGAGRTGQKATPESSRSTFQGFMHAVATECLRALKPGGFMFVTMTPRQDSLARVLIAMEDAGFVMGFTSLYWAYATGFPKALNIGRAVDKRRGCKRSVVGVRRLPDMRGGRYGSARRIRATPIMGGPVSCEAKRLDGAYGGFQPKPAVEVIVVAMKPLTQKTYVDQALASGKGITWLDHARIPGTPVVLHDAPAGTFAGGPAHRGSSKIYRKSCDRFPANLAVSDEALGDFSRHFSLDAWARQKLPFLMVPKASKREKRLVTDTVHAVPGGNDGNTHPTVKPLALMAYLITLGSRPGDVVLDPFLGSGTTAAAAKLLGRRYIGIERERSYFDIARARIRAGQGG